MISESEMADTASRGYQKAGKAGFNLKKRGAGKITRRRLYRKWLMC